MKCVITQNIDGLDERAGITELIEIHGNRSRLRCIDCSARRRLGGYVMDGPPAPCGGCGGAVKYDTVMFGEPVPEDTMGEARRQTGLADCMVAIGTSATVRPASGLLWIAKANGARIIEINPNETKLTPIVDLAVRGKASEAVPMLAEAVSRLIRTRLANPGAGIYQRRPRG